MGKVILGDAIEVMRTFEDNSIDALISDIPYGVKINPVWDKGLPSEEVWEECYRILKPGSHCVIFGQPSMNQKLMSVMSNTEFDFRDTWIWHYQGTHTKGAKIEEEGSTFRSMIRNVFNPIYVFRKKLEGSEVENWEKYRTNLFNIDSVREPYEGDHSRLLERYKETGVKHKQSEKPSNTFGSMKRKGWVPDERGREPVNIRYVPRATRFERTINGKVDNNHETVKPLKLMLWLVNIITTKGQIVIDPFCGSGTTGCACKLLERDFVCIDNDENSVVISEKRIESIDDIMDKYGFVLDK